MDKFKYDLDNKILSFDFPTLQYLRFNNKDAHDLYILYTECSKMQENHVIRATNKFCLKGLGWGMDRLVKAKNFLKSANLIEIIVNRGARGRIASHWVRIKINQNTCPPCIVGKHQKHIKDKERRKEEKDSFSFQEKEVAPPPNPDHEKILQHWNQTFKDIRGVSKHRSLNAFSTRYMKSGKYQYKSITDTLQEAEDKGYTLDQIKTAITNYYQITLNSEYQRVWTTLGNFIYAGVVNKTGFIKFLSNDNGIDPFKGIREVFKPVTLKYDEHNIFNKDEYTYYGVSVNKLTDEKDMLETISDIRSYTRRGNFTYGCLNYIEIVIASLLYTRKKHPQLELINEMMGH